MHCAGQIPQPISAGPFKGGTAWPPVRGPVAGMHKMAIGPCMLSNARHTALLLANSVPQRLFMEHASGLLNLECQSSLIFVQGRTQCWLEDTLLELHQLFCTSFQSPSLAAERMMSVDDLTLLMSMITITQLQARKLIALVLFTTPCAF